MITKLLMKIIIFSILSFNFDDVDQNEECQFL